MENPAAPATAKKKFPWKITIVVILVLGITITTVVLVRKSKKKAMIEKIKASGSSISDDLLNSMTYSDLKKLADATNVH